MKHLIEFPLDDGGSMIVEVDEPRTAAGMERVTRPGEIAAKARETFESSIERIKPGAEAIIKKLGSLSDAPHEIEVEFGITLSAEAGAFIASVGAEANYKVVLKWNRSRK